MMTIESYFQECLQHRERIGNYRTLTTAPKGWIDFASNDYLGFLHDGILLPLIEEEYRLLTETGRAWHGAGGSRLLTGNSCYAERLENEIARFHEAEAGLIYHSGYMANLGLLSAIMRPEDIVLYDSGIHASMHDAIQLAKVKALPFRHQDLAHFEKRLSNCRGRVFVCVESVYSCDGSQTNLSKFQPLSESAGAHLIVDEAHATGSIGLKGEGAVQMSGLQSKIFARVHTFSKALGGQGAIVLGSALLRRYLINFSRPFIYTTALPHFSLAAIRSAYLALERNQECRKRLLARIDYFRSRIKKGSLLFSDSKSPIQCLSIPGSQTVKRVAQKLQENGLDVRALLSPTVRRGRECLRICLHAFNTEKEIDFLIDQLEIVFKNLPQRHRENMIDEILFVSVPLW